MHVLPPLSLTITADALEDQIFADLSLVFAHKPVFRYAFEVAEGDISLLIKTFPEELVRCYRFSSRKKNHHEEVVFRFDSTCFVYIFGYQTKFLRIYADCAEKAEAMQVRLKAVLPEVETKKKHPSFYMLRSDDNKVSTQTVKNTAAEMDDESMSLSYGADIHTWMDDFKTQTEAKPGGITLLEGPPGTGKSSLITQLMRRLWKSHVFYTLAVGQHDTLTQSGLVQFWQAQTERHPNQVKVVVIEDAERILLARDESNNEAVSALLNIADGLLGQMLKVHLFCTLNQKASILDSAILRPGRLRNHRHVGLLTKENALLLAAKQKVTFIPSPDRETYSLAEVFNPPVYKKPEDAKVLGFHIVQAKAQ